MIERSSISKKKINDRLSQKEELEIEERAFNISVQENFFLVGIMIFLVYYFKWSYFVVFGVILGILIGNSSRKLSITRKLKLKVLNGEDIKKVKVWNI